MTIYNVHIYRQMRLVFNGIEAASHEAAAESVRRQQTDHYDDIADCDGETSYACVDVQGDAEYEHSRWIDFQPERQRQAAGALLSTLKAVAELRHKWRSQDEAVTIDSIQYMDGLDAVELDATIAQAESAGILPKPAPEIARFDSFEIEPRIRHWEDGDPQLPDHIACEEHEADMWRLYGNRPGRDSICIGEYTTRSLAQDVYAGITGCCYDRQS
jgi:hypothetical protein